MPFWHALIFGIVEGITEFLPVSSTGHLTVTEKLLGYPIDRADVTAFTAIIQVGAVLALIIYLRKDIVRIVAAWFRGLAHADQRDTLQSPHQLFSRPASAAASAARNRSLCPGRPTVTRRCSGSP